MLQSRLFSRTLKDDPSDEVSVNARLLLRGGFIAKEIAGVFNYLPLGLRVLNNIANIVREEMAKAGGQEILMPALQNKESWEATRRWNNFDALFTVKSKYGNEYALGPTHEEVITPIAKKIIQSYKDLPLAVFQIQTKFRDEARAKSGILRGREFLMKDLYSFHKDEKDFERYYEHMKKVYMAVFKRCGLNAIETEAGGGDFSKVLSHEYQVLTRDGEDTIFYCENGDFAQNKEISAVSAGMPCPRCNGTIQEGKSIEVGNIFPIGKRFSEPLGLKFRNENGAEDYVVMGCYGIGISRLMGSVVEVHNDEKGVIWPDELAPYSVHLLALGEDRETIRAAEGIYRELEAKKSRVLFDDRIEKSAGEKFSDADLIGIPLRVVVSGRSLERGCVEVKRRNSVESKLVKKDIFVKQYAG